MRVLGCKSEAIAAASNLGRGTLLLEVVVVEVVVGEDFFQEMTFTLKSAK